MLRFLICPALGAAVALTAASAQQRTVTLSPFVTMLPSGSPQPMAGLALGLAAGPLAVRMGGHLSVHDRNNLAATNSTVTTRPWGIDIDALAYLESLSYGEVITFSPYVFTGVSTAAVDSGTLRMSRQGWSYGSGLALPLGSALGVYGEWRWRMSRFVLPYAADAPSPTDEARLGITFRVGGSGSGGDVVPIIPAGEGGQVWEGSSTSEGIASRVLFTADEYVGTRYRRGGMTPSSGFDAAGFVRFVFARFGVILPRTSRNQARVGERLRADWHVIEPGDLVMFQDDGGVSHVAIYVGQNRIIHSSATGGGVRYDDLSTERGRWFLDHLVAARRVTPDLRGLLLDLAREFAAEDANTADVPDRAPRASSTRRRSGTRP